LTLTSDQRPPGYAPVHEISAWETPQRDAEPFGGGHFTAIMDLNNDAVVSIGAARTVVFFNKAAEKLFGYDASEVIGQEIEMLLPGHLRTQHRHAVVDFQAGDAVTRSMGHPRDIVGCHKDGREFSVRASIYRSGEGESTVMTAILADVTQDLEMQDTLKLRAFYDHLTGLPNRTRLLDWLASAVERSKDGGSPMAVMFIDLDRFKIVNDSLGHAAGDAVLVQVARRLLKTLRGRDIAGRLGGDEFLVVCEDIAGRNRAISVAERLVRSIEEPMQFEGHHLHVSASIGIATSDGSSSAEELIADADAAMYAAKHLKSKRIVVFDDTIRSRMLKRIDLEHELRHAIERDQFQVLYQPIVELQTGEIVGAEALIRWDHPKYGTLSPDEFIPLAEETGVIQEIDLWVLDTVCRQLAEWGSDGPLGPGGRVSVNVSPVDLTNQYLALSIVETMRVHGVAPRRLCLEITETSMLDDTTQTIALLARLHSLGFSIAIDDFGAGSASLRHLSRIKFDTIKIDKQFVRTLDSESAAAVMAAIVAIAEPLGVTMVAEGIETWEQFSTLTRLGVRFGQGYLFAPPMPAEYLRRFAVTSVPASHGTKATQGLPAQDE
jgi:diguanylate cyclase (GGDEF)-like protein/PAS domain S-box-containing protein